MKTYVPKRISFVQDGKLVKICLTSRRGRPGGQRYDSTRMRTFMTPFSYYTQGKCYAICTNICTGSSPSASSMIPHCLTPIPAGGTEQHTPWFGLWSADVPRKYRRRDIDTANGTVKRQSLLFEMRLIRPDGTPASDLSQNLRLQIWWSFYSGVITPAAKMNTQLSGPRIRRHFYFATALGNLALYISEKKNGIVSQLPDSAGGPRTSINRLTQYCVPRGRVVPKEYVLEYSRESAVWGDDLFYDARLQRIPWHMRIRIYWLLRSKSRN
jgi:hypothetical protein